MKRNSCGLKSVILKHPLKFLGFTDVASKAQPEEPTGLMLRWFAAALLEDYCEGKVMSGGGQANLVHSTARSQRITVRSTFGAELNGLVDSMKQVLLLQVALHPVYCGSSQAPEDMVNLLEHGGLYPPLDISVDARAVFDAASAGDACIPAESSLNTHLISMRGRIFQGIIRKLFWIDTRDMVVDGLADGGVDRFFLHNIAHGCKHEARHEVMSLCKAYPNSRLHCHLLARLVALGALLGWCVSCLPSVGVAFPCSFGCARIGGQHSCGHEGFKQLAGNNLFGS